jgi:hypothetical protein
MLSVTSMLLIVASQTDYQAAYGPTTGDFVAPIALVTTGSFVAASNLVLLAVNGVQATHDVPSKQWAIAGLVTAIASSLFAIPLLLEVRDADVNRGVVIAGGSLLATGVAGGSLSIANLARQPASTPYWAITPSVGTDGRTNLALSIGF